MTNCHQGNLFCGLVWVKINHDDAKSAVEPSILALLRLFFGDFLCSLRCCIFENRIHLPPPSMWYIGCASSEDVDVSLRL